MMVENNEAESSMGFEAVSRSGSRTVSTVARFLSALAVFALAMCFGAAVAFAADSADPYEQAMESSLPNGVYTVNVSMAGGSGRASIQSPAQLDIQGGKVAAIVEWSSENYDYMLVGEQKFLPLNTSGNSTFKIPVTAMDEPMTVVGDTTAMAQAHEVEYQLTFDSSSIVAGAPAKAEEPAGSASSASSNSSASAAASSTASATDAPKAAGFDFVPVIAVIAIAVVAGIAFGIVRGRKSREM